MELNEFISETILSVIKGINNSKEFAETNGAIINPLLNGDESDKLTAIWRKDGNDGKRALTTIDFDVAVTASSEEDNKVGGGLKIQVLNLGASSANREINHTSSRVKFSINVALPHQGDK